MTPQASRVLFRAFLPRLLLTLALIGTVALEGADEGLKVLFIGNSFTIASGGNNTVPGQFDHLARTLGEVDPLVQMRATGGYTYQQHFNDSLTAPAIAAQKWDYVILQNYSTAPTHLNGGVGITDHYTYGERLYDTVIANHPETQVILYETWSRAVDHSLISGGSTNNSFASTAQMQEELRTNYDGLAAFLNAKHPENKPVLVAPVGDAWENAGGLRELDDPLYVNLHGSDRYHGNANGYYLSAAVFFSMIYGRSAEGAFALAPPIALSASGEFLESVAWRTVESKTAESNAVRIDFGHAGDASAGFNAMGPDFTGLSNLVNLQGEDSWIGLEVTSSFLPGVTNSGTTASTVFGFEVSRDSLSGDAAISPRLLFSGLSTEARYVFRFYASVEATGTNFETIYEVVGSHRESVSLNPSGNIDTIAASGPILPDAQGRITLSLSAGAQNTSAAGECYLGALVVVKLPYVPLVLSRDLEDVTITSGQMATFSVGYEGTEPIAVTWYVDGEPQTGVEGTTFEIPLVSAAMDGAIVSAVLSDGSKEVPTRDAILTVQVSSIAPEFVSVAMGSSLSEWILEFSEALDPATALATEHYSILSGDSLIPVQAVSQSTDGRFITLELFAPVYADFEITLSEALKDFDGLGIASSVPIAVDLRENASTVWNFDFGSTGNLTTSGALFWNNVSNAVATSGSGGIQNLVTSGGETSEVDFSMLSRFNSVNSNGVTSSTLFPASATGDSLFGNVELFGNLSHIYPAFRLSGLDLAADYRFTFYASRSGVSDNRETLYTLVGATTETVALDPSQNVDGVAISPRLRPAQDGSISVSLSPGANNNNAYHFMYLNVMLMQKEWTMSVATPPTLNVEPVAGGLRFSWEGEGVLEFADDLAGPWKVVTPLAISPYIVTDDLPPRFFRLR